MSFSLSTARFLKTTHKDMILNFNQYGQLHKYQANIESLSRYSRARYEKHDYSDDDRSTLLTFNRLG